MSVRVPAAPVDLLVRQWREDQPILSGDGVTTAIERRGLRGLVSEQNHAYVYRTRVLMSGAHPVMSGVLGLYSTAGGGWEIAVRRLGVYVGEDVSELELLADVTGGQVRLVAGGTTGTASTSVIGRAVHRVTVPVVGGSVYDVRIEVLYDPGAAILALHSYRVRELGTGAVVPVVDEGLSMNSYNVRWDRPTVSTIRVRRRDANQPSWIVVRNAAAAELRMPIDATGYTWDITVSGLGGRRAATAEAANTLYCLYFVSDGVTPYLVGEVNGTALTYLALAALNAAYTYKSGIVGLGSNSGGGSDLDLLPCENIGSTGWRYLHGNADNWILTGGTATTTTKITGLGIFVPAVSGAQAEVSAYTLHTGNSGECYLYSDAGTTELHALRDRFYAAGGQRQSTDPFLWPIVAGDPENSMWYKYSVTPSYGLSVQVRAAYWL